jgi:hypothetical protein
MRWQLIVILLCVPLMMHTVEHFFMCIFTISVSSFEKYLLWITDHFVVRFFVYLFWVLIQHLAL